MNTRRIIILLAALSCMMGCVRQLESADQTGDSVVFKAVNGDNPETKTMLQTDGSIVWSAADEINLFYGSGHSTKFTSTNTSPASEVDFKGSLNGFAYNDTDLFWATYPYNEANQCDGNSVTVTLPAEQTAVAGTFANDLFIGVARTKDFNLRFYNVCGGVKFSVTAEGVRSVVFKGKNGEVLAGTAKVVFGEDGKPSVSNVTNPKTEIKVSAPEGSSFEVGKWYYLVSLPVSLQNGFFFTLEKPNGSTATKEYGKTVSVKRSVWGVLKDSDGTLEYSEIDADQTLYEVSAAGGPVELAVQTNVDTEVTVNVEWMHYMETKTLSSKTVVLSVDRNESTASREGTVTIKQQNSSLRQTITVRQAGWIAVTSVSLDQTSLTLQAEETATLVATVKPDDATDKTVTWTSSAPEIATVDESGKVTAVKKGTARITAEAGGKSATCSVVVHGIDTPDAIDLGLSVKWASFNIGASSPEEYGVYYAWGETEPKSDYGWPTYKWANGALNKLTKYCPAGKTNYWDGAGSPDGKTELDPEDDVAHVKLGGKWRMPTNAEWDELYNTNNCTWTWTTQNGVYGRRVTSNKNGNSIFLPAAGYRNGSDIFYTGSDGYYWSSSLSTGVPYAAWYVLFYSDYVFRYDRYRYYGLSVRAVMEAEIPVTSIELNKPSLKLAEGDSEMLTAIVKPDNATDKTVTWSSSDSEIATVDESGKVSAVKKGTATITAEAGGKSATCSVVVHGIDTPDAIDLGLSVKWASFNIGASSPEEYGLYYAWGETEPKSDYSWSTYKWANGDYNKLTKYCPAGKTDYWDGAGSPDGKTELDPEDDVAHVKLGGKWRMPTDAEWSELLNNCTRTWTTQNGVYGRRVTSNKNGNSIFLPAAGHRSGTGIYDTGSYGYYWSSSLNTGYPGPGRAWYVYFYSGGVFRFDYGRCSGQSVRAVSE